MKKKLIVAIFALLSFAVLNSCTESSVGTSSEANPQGEASSELVTSMSSEIHQGRGMMVDGIIQLPDGNLLTTCDDKRQIILYNVEEDTWRFLKSWENETVKFFEPYKKDGVIIKTENKQTGQEGFYIIDTVTGETSEITADILNNTEFSVSKEEFYVVGDGFRKEELEGYTAYVCPEEFEDFGEIEGILGVSGNEIFAVYYRGVWLPADENDEPFLKTLIAYDLQTQEHRVLFQTEDIDVIIMIDDQHMIVSNTLIKCHNISDFSVANRICDGDIVRGYASSIKYGPQDTDRFYYVKDGVLTLISKATMADDVIVKYDLATGEVLKEYRAQDQILMISPWKNDTVLFIKSEESEGEYTESLMLTDENDEIRLIAENVDSFYVCGDYVVTVNDGLLNRIEIE